MTTRFTSRYSHLVTSLLSSASSRKIFKWLDTNNSYIIQRKQFAALWKLGGGD